MAFLSQLKADDYQKKPGDLIKSADWNALGQEVINLGGAKVDRDGDTIQGELRVTGAAQFSNTLAVAGNVAIGTATSTVKLGITGPVSTTDNDAQGMLRLIRPADPRPTVAGARSVDLRVGRAGSGGQARLEIALSGPPGDNNAAGTIPDVTIMTLLGTGNVGIGTTNPTAKLEVNGALTITGATTLAGNVDVGANNALSFGSQMRQMLNLYGAAYGIGVQSSTHYWRTGAHFAWYKGGLHDNAVLNPGANGGVQMVIRDSGNVGIGTADPQAKLEVNGTMKASGATTLGSTLTVTGATTLNGTVTIGTSTANRNLIVNGAVTATSFSGNGAGLTGLTTNQIPDLDASKITTGTLNVDRIPSLPASKIASGGTMAGVLTVQTNGNVGIGTVNPTTKLEVSGTMKASGATTLGSTLTVTGATTLNDNVTIGLVQAAKNLTVYGKVGIGTTTPYERFTLVVDDDTTNPLHIVKHKPGPSEQSYLMILQSGNVGIGTKTPSAKLEVNGTVKATSFSGSGADLTGLTATQIPNLSANKITSDALHVDRIPNLPASKITTGTMAGALTILANGNVGIGMTSPLAKLEVNGTLKVSGAITPSPGNTSSTGIMFPTDPFGGTGDAAWIRYHNARGGEKATLEIGISNDADDHIILNPSGNVGIGTTDPQAKLEVNGTLKVADNTNLSGNVTIGTTAQYGNRNLIVNGAVTATSFSGSGANLTGLDANKITTGILNAAQIPSIPGDRITSGKLADVLTLRPNKTVDIGGTRMGSGTELLYVFGDTILAGSCNIASSLHVSGKATGSQPWQTTSDMRIKTNPLPVTPLRSLQRMLGLTLYEYGYLPEFQPESAGQKYHGFLAQEVEQIIPEAVYVVGDHKLGEGRVIEGLRAVAHDRIFSEAVGAIQALHALLQSQAARLQVLEQQLAVRQPT